LPSCLLAFLPSCAFAFRPTDRSLRCAVGRERLYYGQRRMSRGIQGDRRWSQADCPVGDHQGWLPTWHRRIGHGRPQRYFRWPVCKAGGLSLSSTSLDASRCTLPDYKITFFRSENEDPSSLTALQSQPMMPFLKPFIPSGRVPPSRLAAAASAFPPLAALDFVVSFNVPLRVYHGGQLGLNPICILWSEY
jgi:hypothetical protein